MLTGVASLTLSMVFMSSFSKSFEQTLLRITGVVFKSTANILIDFNRRVCPSCALTRLTEKLASPLPSATTVVLYS